MISRKHYWTAFLGNLFENYEKALFHLLVPFLCPLFFADFDPLTAMIVLFLPLGFLTKPLGALFFGYIGDKLGRKVALFYTILGMAISTTLMGLVPTYAQIGKLAPILLISFRMLQTFFSSGETTGGALILLENKDTKKKEFLSSLYEAVGIAGFFLAATGIFIFSHFGIMEKYWRYLFFFGAISGAISFWIRLYCHETKTTSESAKYSEIRSHGWVPLFAITSASAFSYMTYTLSITFLSCLVPLISSLDIEEVASMNSMLLLLDMLLLPCFGFVCTRVSKDFIMKSALILTIFLSIPAFLLLKNSSFAVIFFVRSIFMVLGVAFAAPYHSWAQQIVPAQFRYTIISLGKAIGSGMIGASTISISLWLYKQTGWIFAPALYSIAIAGVTLFSMRLANQKYQQTQTI